MGQRQWAGGSFGVAVGVVVMALAAVGGCTTVEGPARATEQATSGLSPDSVSPPDTGFSVAPPTSPSTVTTAVIYGCDSQPAARPVDFILLCGDAGETLVHLAWSGWGKTSASATGQIVVKSCTPDCADGASIPYVATVTVTGLSSGSYTKIHISAPRAPVPAQNFAVDTKGPVPLTPLPTGY